MIQHALRGAPKLDNRFVCVSCFLEISTLFHRRQLRNYAATAQSQAAELKPQDDGAEAESLKTPEVMPTTHMVPTKRTEKRKRSRSSSVPIPKASFRKDYVGGPKRSFREAHRQKVDTKIAATGTLEPQGSQDRVNNNGEKALPDNKRTRMTHRSTRQKGVPFSGAFLNSTIKDALLGRDGQSQKKAPCLTRKGTSPDNIRVIDSSTLHIQPVDAHDQPPIPNLSHGLERALFNPGVYHLQDPRSRVYNFDPYLQSIMPIAEFDFDALKEYITSSQDESLRLLAKDRGKKYVGSSSSTTGALAHFHFLLSQWREINTQNLSQGFPTKLKSFTVLQRSPAAIFLRWNGDSYAIDADKEFDSANILSMLGKSMEKLLTLPTHEFERYRKSSPGRISEEERNAPESFHYCTFGDFLLRSQLDAHDARLPGTGMFDLKTRAVVSIRMNAENYHDGLGYEIKSQFGEWESYEREYFDMIRAAFLKYSLQVRIGRMDGIFVAFHNTERIFGFQYISLPEMDSALHGATDTITGDREFKLSLELLNKILDRAIAKYPEKSLRIHFETREAQAPFMYIFAEPVSEEQILEIQTANKEKIEAFERNILGLNKEGKTKVSDEAEETKEESDSEWEHIKAKVEQELQDDETSSGDIAISEGAPTGALEGNSDELAGATGNLSDHADFASWPEGQDEQRAAVSGQGHGEDEDKTGDQSKVGLVESDEPEEKAPGKGDDRQAKSGSRDLDSQTSKSNEPPSAILQEEDLKKMEDSEDEADKLWLEEVAKEQQDLVRQADDRDLLAMTLSIRNKVNGRYVLRPDNLSERDNWTVEYSLAEVSTASRAWSLYGACQTRRKKALEANDASHEDVAANYYLRTIRDLSRAGRAWRKKQDKIDSAAGKVVLGGPAHKSQEEPPSTGSSETC